MISGDSGDSGDCQVSAVVVFRQDDSLHTDDDVPVSIGEGEEPVIRFVDKGLEEYVHLDKTLRSLCHCKLYKLNYIDTRISMITAKCNISTVYLTLN